MKKEGEEVCDRCEQSFALGEKPITYNEKIYHGTCYISVKKEEFANK